MYDIKEELKNITNAWCSSFSWCNKKEDLHFWGRNFDFNRYAQGTAIIYIPKNYPYYVKGSKLENSISIQDLVYSKYPCVGMGSMIMESTPIMYDGINSEGLSGGQLNFRKDSEFVSSKTQKLEIQPIYLVTYLLTQCASIKEVEEVLNNNISVIKSGVFGQIPEVHFFFSDSNGNTLIIEFEKGELKMYKNRMGVLTNSPSYDWHEKHMEYYINLRNLDYDNINLNSVKISQSFSGNGMIGLPGDCSSMSRFVKLSILKKFAIKGDDEIDCVVKMFKILDQVSFPLGLVKVSYTDDINRKDINISEYDYTIYTSIICNESKRYYWKTYDDVGINCVDLNEYKDCEEIKQFKFIRNNNISYL